VGIHTGPVVAGIVGVKKFQYDIWGDTVNTASRMESSGEPGRVNISESTYSAVKDDPRFRFIPRGKVEAKGKGEVEMWFVRESWTSPIGQDHTGTRS
jgi:adenylate cyclase